MISCTGRRQLRAEWSRALALRLQLFLDQQLANINAQNQQFLNQQQQTGNLLNSQFQSILNNPGLSAADKAAVTGQSQGTIASAFDSLQQSAANRVARTGNSAGFSELTDDLVRQKAVSEGNQAQQNQLALTNTAFQRRASAHSRVTVAATDLFYENQRLPRLKSLR